MPAITTTLCKLSAHGAKLVWRIGKQLQIQQGVIVVEWGTERGKMQRVTKTIAQGKQGRTVDEQMDLEIASLIKQKKAKHGYAEAVDEGVQPKQQEEKAPPLPMLAQPWPDNIAQRLKDEDSEACVFVQPKLDGLRCIADLHTGVLYSRARKPFTSLQHIADDVVKLASSSSSGKGAAVRYVDGEIYLHGMDFQTITSIARRRKPAAAADQPPPPQLQLHVFDCVHTGLDFKSRWQLLKALFHDAGVEHVKLCATEEVALPPPSSSTDGDTLSAVFDQHLDQCIAKGYEGVMVRLSGGEGQCYQPGVRSRHLLKLKRFAQEEFRVVAFQKHAELDTLGSVLLQPLVTTTDSTEQQFSATPANTAQFKAELWAARETYSSGDYVATVKFQSLSKDGIPRFPVLVGLRHKDDCGT